MSSISKRKESFLNNLMYYLLLISNKHLGLIRNSWKRREIRCNTYHYCFHNLMLMTISSNIVMLHFFLLFLSSDKKLPDKTKASKWSNFSSVSDCDRLHNNYRNFFLYNFLKILSSEVTIAEAKPKLSSSM